MDGDRLNSASDSPLCQTLNHLCNGVHHFKCFSVNKSYMLAIIATRTPHMSAICSFVLSASILLSGIAHTIAAVDLQQRGFY